MKELKLVVEYETLHQSKSGTITGVMYFDSLSEQFPEAGWNDFIVVVMGWWIPELASLTNGSANTAELSFMDGPYTLKVVKTENGDFSLFRTDGKQSIQFVTLSKIDFEKFVVRLKKSARKIVEECEKKSWKSDDLSTLKQILSRIYK